MIVDGDAGDYLGAEMRAGTISCLGRLPARSPVPGRAGR